MLGTFFLKQSYLSNGTAHIDVIYNCTWFYDCESKITIINILLFFMQSFITIFSILNIKETKTFLQP